MEARHCDYIVYKISNNVNHKIYFGITEKGLRIRWAQHKSRSKKSNNHLYKAFRKYGIHNFNIEVVFKTEVKDEMFLKEKELIRMYNTNDPMFGYNKSSGGEHGASGRKLTSIEKNRLSEINKNRKRNPFSEEAKLNMRNAAKGRNMDSSVFASAEKRRGKPAKNTKSVILNGSEFFESITIAAKSKGTSVTVISNNLLGLSKKTKIGIWEYASKN